MAHESRNGVSLDAPARVVDREGGATRGGNGGQPRVGTQGCASEDAAARLSAGARFPPVQRHERMTQIPGARRTTSEYQGHGIDEPEALREAVRRSLLEGATASHAGCDVGAGASDGTGAGNGARGAVLSTPPGSRSTPALASPVAVAGVALSLGGRVPLSTSSPSLDVPGGEADGARGGGAVSASAGTGAGDGASDAVPASPPVLHGASEPASVVAAAGAASSLRGQVPPHGSSPQPDVPGEESHAGHGDEAADFLRDIGESLLAERGVGAPSAEPVGEPANVSAGVPQVPRGTGPQVGAALGFVMAIETEAIGHCPCPTLVMAPPGALHSVATVVRRVLAHLPALDPHPAPGVDRSFGAEHFRRAVRQVNRASAAGASGDRVDWLVQLCHTAVDIEERLFQLISHMAHGPTPVMVDGNSTQQERDQLAWWRVLYLLPRWLLATVPEAAREDDESITQVVEARCWAFMRFQLESLHRLSGAGSAERAGARAGDALGGAGVPPPVSKAARANMLADVGELRRAAMTLDSTTHLITKALCDKRGTRGAWVWELCLRRVRELHPQGGDDFTPDSVPHPHGGGWCLGGVPPELRRVHFGARLFCSFKGTPEQWERVWGDYGPINYDDVKVRPILVGGALDKLVQKSQQLAANPALARTFQPLQYGVAVPSGMDMLVWAQRAHALWQPRGVTVLEDAGGAFPSASRRRVAEAIVRYGHTSLFGYYAAGHSGSQPVYVDGVEGPVLMASSGLFQGKVLASAYFCLGLHPLLEEMHRSFPRLRVSAIIDDVQFQGPVRHASAAHAWLRLHGPEYGYNLNASKGAVVPHSDTIGSGVSNTGDEPLLARSPGAGGGRASDDDGPAGEDGSGASDASEAEATLCDVAIGGNGSRRGGDAAGGADGGSGESDLFAAPLVRDDGEVRVFTDGGANPNPGTGMPWHRSGCGSIVLEAPPGGFATPVHDASGDPACDERDGVTISADQFWCGRESTNNTAEYLGVLSAVYKLGLEGRFRAVVTMDSRLVVDQFAGRCRVGLELQPYYDLLMRFGREFKRKGGELRLVHRRRAHNTRADALATMATWPGHGRPLPGALLDLLPDYARPYGRDRRGEQAPPMPEADVAERYTVPRPARRVLGATSRRAHRRLK